MNTLKNLLLTIGVALGATTALALSPSYETVTVSGAFTIAESSVQTVSLQNARYIRNIVVQAEGYNRDSMIEVMVNGEVKGTIYAPGHDPSYVVTIGETATSIQFRHRSGGAMRVLNVVATLSTWAGHPPYGGGHSIGGSLSQVEDLANQALMAIEAIRQFSTVDEETTYLMPIKRKAGQVLIMAGAHGDLSGRTATALINLQNQIDFASEYIGVMMEKDGLFEAAVDLLTVRERINDLLD